MGASLSSQLSSPRGKTGTTETSSGCGHSWLVTGTTQAVQTVAVFSYPACPSSGGDPAVFSATSGRGQGQGGNSAQGSPGSSGTGPAPLSTTAKTLSKLNRGFSKQKAGRAAAPVEQVGLYTNICTSAPITRQAKQKQRHKLSIFFFYYPP